MTKTAGERERAKEKWRERESLQGDKANSVWVPCSSGSSCVLLVDEYVCEVNDAAKHESSIGARTHTEWRVLEKKKQKNDLTVLILDIL